MPPARRLSVVPRRLLRLVVTCLLVASGSLGAAAWVPTRAAADAPPTGPDVSSHQHPHGTCIDWAAVAAGSDTAPARQFAFIKATEGSSYTNPYFRSCARNASKGDWRASQAAGLAHGAYHFARPALPMSTAVTQADYFLSVAGALTSSGDLPPVLDLEVTGGLAPGDLVTWAQTWLDRVRQKAGRVPIVYTYPYFVATALGGTSAFASYPLWIADYNGSRGPSTPLPGGWQSWTTWQYTSNAGQPGIPTGSSDMSQLNGDATTLAALADGTQPPTWSVAPPSAPIDVSATPMNTAAKVRWVPGNNGGALVSSYIVTASSGAKVTVPGASTSATVSGLVNGHSYTFSVHALNSAGPSPESAPSPRVTPVVPTDVFSSIAPAQVIYGNTATMAARLVRTDTGDSLPGLTLTVYSRPHGGTSWTHVADVRTDSHGVGRWSFRARRSTDVMMRWLAPSGWQSQQTYTRVATVVPVPTDIHSWLSSTTVRYPRAVMMHATLVRTDTGRRLSGRLLVVFRKPHGTRTWVRAAVVRTDRYGTARWRFVPRRTTDVMMRWSAPIGWAGQQTFVRTVRVIPIPTWISSWLSHTKIARGGVTTMYATLSRADTHRVLTGRVLVVYAKQHGTRRWSRVAIVRTNWRGTAHWSFRPAKSTDVMMRWYAPAGWSSRRSYIRTVAVR